MLRRARLDLVDEHLSLSAVQSAVLCLCVTLCMHNRSVVNTQRHQYAYGALLLLLLLLRRSVVHWWMLATVS